MRRLINMNLILFLGQGFVANESEADLLVNKLLAPRIADLRNELKDTDNIDLPLVRIKDSGQNSNGSQIAECEIVLECDGVQKWKQDFSLASFESIVDSVVNILRRVAKNEI